MAFALSVVCLIPLEQWIPGFLAFGVCLILLWRSKDPTLQRRLGVLLACVLTLAFAPIGTDTSNLSFLTLGVPFVAVLLIPWWTLRRSDPGVLDYTFWPRKFSLLETAYTLLSIPVAWLAFRLYFGVLSPEVPFNWTLPTVPTFEALARLFAGINLVGIWDELFFINTAFAILRSLYPLWAANLVQAILYTAVLFDMAFTGWGPLFVFALALTQGVMFERSKVLLYVIVVHLIVDYFLFQEIVEAYYPNFSVWWHP